MKRLKYLFSVLVAVAFSLSAASLRAADSGIYLLFVWGTQDPATLKGVEISEKKIEAALIEDNSPYAQIAEEYSDEYYNTAGGLVKLNKYIKFKKTLKGADATNAKIKEACEDLAELAGPNDAVMVYILCHGAAIKSPRDGKLRHGLAPSATSAKDLQMNKYGIARGTIMKAIKSRPHRLNVLITDSCSATEPYKPVEPLDQDHPGGPDNPYLVQFLLKAHGDLNINSSRPQTGPEVGELARGVSPERWQNVPSDPKARNVYERYAGTVFTNAFLKVAETMEYHPDTDLNVTRFFEKLRDALDEQYWNTKDYLKETNQIGAFGTFNKQSTQTLTRFTDDSVAYPEDLKWKTRFSSGSGSSGSF